MARRGEQPNPYDEVLDTLVGAMRSIRDDLRTRAKDVRPFNTQRLSPAEADLLYAHPALRYPDALDETTGLPLTNAQAAARYLHEVGPVRYAQWVDEMETQRRGAPPSAGGQEVTDARQPG